MEHHPSGSASPARPRFRPGPTACLLAAAAAALFALHGLYALLLGDNFHAVVPGQVYRSAQPSPGQLRRWADRYGIRTVVNLRGDSSREFYEPEHSAAEDLGLRVIDVRLSAIHQPPVPALRRLIRALETAPRPILLHCRRGADRTGLAGVLAAMAVGGEDYAAARRQLSWRFGHVDDDPEHIGGLLVRYEQWCRNRRLDTDGWAQFRQWALSEYHPYYYFVQLGCPQRLTARPGSRLAADVVVTNRSGRAIPAGDPDRRFGVAAFLGSTVNDRPDQRLGPRTLLPQRDIAPGRSVRVRVGVRAPAATGRYDVHFDVVEEHRTWFARQGSPMGACELVVVGGAKPKQ